MSREKFILDESTESLDTLSKQLGQKLMPKSEKKTPKYCYEVYWYDNEECDGDPMFKKFWTKKEQQQWYEEHKNDPDKFNMYDLDGYNINENLNEENLPDVELEEPITISDTKFELEEPSEDVIINANVGLINDLISREWELINEYKSIIATLELDNQEELITILNSVVDEKTIQLGMLNKAVELLDDGSIDLMKQGEEKAEEILAEKESPVDESLNKEEK